ncbi:hypothetical protein [Lentibacillus songyuanensis]|uniref:hypothetical protein n=1 Tax=Lentibacillus songyuanensis TaxID=3136161 RepID=UPI0031BB9561
MSLTEQTLLAQCLFIMLRNYQRQIDAVGEDIDFEQGPNDPLLARVESIHYDVTDNCLGFGTNHQPF